MIHIPIGADFWRERKEGIRDPLLWREDSLSNHHVGIAGTSGAGKTHWLRKFVNAMPESVMVDIFDYHGDIDIPGAKSVLFSEATRYGYNPLILNTDPHFGGVRRAVTDVIETMTSATRQLGGNQEGVLRHLLVDAYMAKGIFADNPRSWLRREATEAEVKQLIEARNWAALREVYPSLADVISLAKRKLKALWKGIEDKNAGRNALSAFDDYCRAMAAVNQARMRSSRASANGDEDMERLAAKLATAKDKATDAHRIFLDSMETGREFEEATKYYNKEVMLSVITRLESLYSLGLFNPNPPPFGDAQKRRYVLAPIAQSEDELRMFVRFRLKAILREEMQRGESFGRLRRLVVIDECAMFNDEDRSNPINRLVNEGRKFGIGLLQAGQSPAQWSSAFIKSAGTLLLLNLATADWDDAARKLKIDVKDLRYLRPKATGAVRMLEEGQAATFRQVSFSADRARTAAA